MKTKIVSVDKAVPGMLVANDIFTFNNQLIINSNTPLNDRIITRLKFYSIDEIEVMCEENITAVEELDVNENNETYYTTIKKSEEFKKFNKAVVNFANEFKTSLNDVFVNGKDVDTMHLLSQINGVVNESRNSIHLLNMLHCMLEYNDYIYTHSINVALICDVFGKWLGFSEEENATLVLCGLLHDIGKLAIPKEILDKKGKISEKEYDSIKAHTTKGYQMLKDKTMNEHIKHTALMHHERCDGSGYPNHYLGRNIDKYAKIVAIADVYDAMVSPRSYRKGLCPFEVIELFEFEGYQKFEAEYVLNFIKGIVESYINASVKLSNGEIGKIVMINKNYLSRPIVQISEKEFLDLSSRADIDIESFV